MQVFTAYAKQPTMPPTQFLYSRTPPVRWILEQRIIFIDLSSVAGEFALSFSHPKVRVSVTYYNGLSQIIFPTSNLTFFIIVIIIIISFSIKQPPRTRSLFDLLPLICFVNTLIRLWENEGNNEMKKQQLFYFILFYEKIRDFDLFAFPLHIGLEDCLLCLLCYDRSIYILILKTHNLNCIVCM